MGCASHKKGAGTHLLKLKAVHLMSTCFHKRYPYSKLQSGDLAAHASARLPLLPSGPDGVHVLTLRKTQLSSPLIRGRPYKNKPRSGIQPCCSGLQVQGTATSPSSTAKVCTMPIDSVTHLLYSIYFAISTYFIQRDASILYQTRNAKK